MYYTFDLDRQIRSNQSNVTCGSNSTVIWIHNVFDQCITNTKEEIGFFLGLVSICCWIFASLPQLYENYRKKKVDEAISFAFLMFWLMGDSSNLIGCILTKQFPIQLYTAVYYVGMDIIMILQYAYYRARHLRRLEQARASAINEALSPENGIFDRKIIVPCLCIMAIVPIALTKQSLHRSSLSDAGFGRRIGRTLLSTNSLKAPLIPTDPTEIIGYVIGCISSVFYVASRLPQIIKNFKRKTTDGVSIYLFILAVIGNALYGSSVLLQDPAVGQTYGQFIVIHLPWLIGSLGTMSFDFTILLQISYFDTNCFGRRQERDTEAAEHLLA